MDVPWVILGSMRRLAYLFIVTLLFIALVSCPNPGVVDDGGGSDGGGGGSTGLQTLGQPFDRTQYLGYVGDNADSTAPLTGNAAVATLSDGYRNSIEAHGYLSLSGQVHTESGYALLELVKGSGEDAERSWYWLTGSFDMDIWLRFGPGEYVVNIYDTSVTFNENGVIIDSFSLFFSNMISFTVANTCDEDGRFLYPSDVIQSDHESLTAAARSAVDGETDVYAIIRTLHDWTVKYLEYDMDSVTGVRKKQDALSAYENRMAVCEGYATLYAALLRAYSIPAAYATGTGNGESHAWNRVSNGSEWRWVDVTWDDPLWNGSGHSDYPEGENLRWNYFWSVTLWEDHVLDDNGLYVSRASSGTYPRGTLFPGYAKGWY